MALETINGTLQLTRLTNESAEYVARREELRLAEIELMRHRERVAAMRRRLPPGAVVQDYVFQEGPANLDAGDTPIATVRLSDLFTGPNRSVVIYHAATARSSTTFEARTRKAGRIQPFRSSLETATVRCGIRIPHIRGWRTMSRSAASTC